LANRLYGYTSATNGTYPPLDVAYAANLRQRKCRMRGRDTAVEMVPDSFLTFDLGYYHAVLKHRALLQSDAALVSYTAARADIAGVVSSPPEVFFQVFGRSMMRLGAVQVMTGSEGEIRKSCSVVNS
jgi:peroxidase